MESLASLRGSKPRSPGRDPSRYSGASASGNHVSPPSHSLLGVSSFQLGFRSGFSACATTLRRAAVQGTITDRPTRDCMAPA